MTAKVSVDSKIPLYAHDKDAEVATARLVCRGLFSGTNPRHKKHAVATFR